MLFLKRLAHHKKLKLLFITLGIASINGIAYANMLKVNAASSSVHFTFKQMEVPVKGEFKRFNAVIDYDSAKPENSKARIDIDLKSIALPAPEYNEEVLKKEWFNAKEFPQANFSSTSMKSLGTGRLHVFGMLSMKGKTIPASFPLTIRAEANSRIFEGNLTVKRLNFNVGEGEWKDTSMLADDIVIQFRITGTQ